jgi:hypothetical protein
MSETRGRNVPALVVLAVVLCAVVAFALRWHRRAPGASTS